MKGVAALADLNKGESGFGIDVEGVLTGAMGHIDHDLVVPTHSALACGRRRGLQFASQSALRTSSQLLGIACINVKPLVWRIRCNGRGPRSPRPKGSFPVA